MFDFMVDASAIVVADLILSGDNALIIGMTAACLSPELRARAIMYGMVIAAVLRIVFAVVATELLVVPGLLFVGGLLLIWVCWRLYLEIREGTEREAEASLAAVSDCSVGYSGPPRRSLASALWTITLADVSMSLDNILAVAAIAKGHTTLLIFGLGLAILFMAFAATLIVRVLARHPWISWLGLIVLVYVSGEMLVRGTMDKHLGIFPMMGIVEGYDFGHGKHH